MSYTVAKLKGDLERKLHGTTLNVLADPDALIYEAGRNLLAQIDPPTTMRISSTEQAIYDDVFRYSVPSDLKGEKIARIRPQAGQEAAVKFRNVYNSDFDKYHGSFTYTIERDTNIKYLRLSRSLPESLLYDTVSDSSTWTLAGDGSNIATDTFYYISHAASVRFDLDASGSAATLTKTLSTPVDLTNYKDVGDAFGWFYTPNADGITGIALKWGSDSSNYYSSQVTTQHDGNALVDGWNLLRFAWSGASTTGSPTVTAVDYTQLSVSYDGTAQTSCRFNSLHFRIGKLYEIIYYSEYLFRDATTGAWQLEIADDTDLINLEHESYNLLLYETAFLAAQEIQGTNAKFDVSFFEQQKDKVWKNYRKQNKSEVRGRRSNYYRMPGTNSSSSYDDMFN